jgi:ribosome biogenesis GTPase
MTLEGRVVANFGQRAAVRTADRNLIRCHIRRRPGLVVCGDFVVYKEQADGGFVIEQCLPRGGTLARPDRKGRLKPLAANIDRLVVVIAPRPQPDWVMVDAFVTYAAQQGLQARLLLNKADTLDDTPASAELTRTGALYAECAGPVIHSSCHTGAGIDELAGALAHGTAVLVGQSGVGKSSIVQALLPDQAVQTRAISSVTGLGSHTTTTTMLYQLGSGALIDSPGVREFDIGHIEPGALQRGFPEFDDHAPHCRFSDCTHVHEPGCAVKAAVDNALIAEVRWRHYRRLLERYKA